MKEWALKMCRYNLALLFQIQQHQLPIIAWESIPHLQQMLSTNSPSLIQVTAQRDTLLASFQLLLSQPQQTLTLGSCSGPCGCSSSWR